jgi:hypothetical protein
MQQVGHVSIEVLPFLVCQVHVPIDFLPCCEYLDLAHVIKNRVDIGVQHSTVLVPQFVLFIIVRGLLGFFTWVCQEEIRFFWLFLR